jgi:hypothetical protein
MRAIPVMSKITQCAEMLTFSNLRLVFDKTIKKLVLPGFGSFSFFIALATGG